MEKIISILLRVDADENLGLGHLSRCRSLMLVFSDLAECNFSIRSNNKELVEQFIPHIGFEWFDADHTCEGQHFDLMVIDVPGIADRNDKSVQNSADLIACIDDEGPGLSFQDILIRPNLLNLPKPPEIARDNYWSGRDYIILHPHFRTQAHRNRCKQGNIRRLLVCFGGSDPCGLTVRVIPILKKLGRHVEVEIILGASFSRSGAVESATGNDHRFSLRQNAADMASAFRNADVALISGGTLLYEACALGIPSVVISQNQSQDAESSFCQSKGAVFSLGVNEAASDGDILLHLQKLLGDDVLRKNMARRGPSIVSPDGAMRIASKLLSRVEGRIPQ